MPISMTGLEPSTRDPDIWVDRRGAGIEYRVSAFGDNAGRPHCIASGRGKYAVFSTWTDLPVGSLMTAEDRQSAVYVFASDKQWIPQGGQYTGSFNLKATRDLNAGDNGTALFNLLAANRSLNVKTTLPLDFSCEVLQGFTGEIDFVAGPGVVLNGASFITAGPGKALRLRRVNASDFIVY